MHNKDKMYAFDNDIRKNKIKKQTCSEFSIVIQNAFKFAYKYNIFLIFMHLYS